MSSKILLPRATPFQTNYFQAQHERFPARFQATAVFTCQYIKIVYSHDILALARYSHMKIS